MKGSSVLLYICLINMFIIDLELTSNTQIIMALTQTILYDLQLPDFINKFKQACISRLLPPIDSAIQFLKTTNNPILMMLLIVLFVELIRIGINQVRNSKKSKTVSEQPDNRGAAREIKDLKRQLKAMQKTVQQLKQNGVNKSSISGRQSVISNQATKSIINSCKESWVKREEIAVHLIEYQTMLMNEVRQLKKSSSRISSPLKSNNAIPVFNNKNAKAPVNLPFTKEQKKTEANQIKKPELVEKVQIKQTVPKAPKLEVPAKRKEVQAPKKVIEERNEPAQQIFIVEHQPVKQVVVPVPQVIQTTTRQSKPQNKQINHTPMPIQQIEKEQVAIPQNNTQISQDLKIQQPPVVVEQTPRPMPPLPKQVPPVGRRPPGPPQKGDRKNPPPPPVRKI